MTGCNVIYLLEFESEEFQVLLVFVFPCLSDSVIICASRDRVRVFVCLFKGFRVLDRFLVLF